MIHVIDLSERIMAGGVKDVDELLVYLKVCEENQLGQAIEVVYTTTDGKSYYINAYERLVVEIQDSKESLYKEAPVSNCFSVGNKEVVLFVKQSEIDAFTQEEVHNYLNSTIYEGNQYVWVNEILNMEGGDNYAIRRIHPNLVETEGEFLSTNMTDAKGNYPYQTELEGIREHGFVFHSYYFKNKLDDKISEKFSYAQYYEPFHWVIATGETIEEVYAASKEMNRESFRGIVLLMMLFIGVFIVTYRFMIQGLIKQSQSFRKTLLKQSEVYEDIYTSMSVGLLRIRMTDESSTILHVNPKGLEILGLDSLKELLKNLSGHRIEMMHSEDAQKLELASRSLKEQWESVVTECHVEWKDGSIRLLRIRDTLVDLDGDGKIIQRMCQDITEERRQQEQAILEAEEKATLDPMTQIKNKKAIENIIRTQIEEAKKNFSPIAIGFVDIDNFRDYNTKYGHMQGDEVIKYVANTIKEYVPGMVGRNGGDEFAFVVPEASYEIIDYAMQMIHNKLNDGIIIKDTGEKIATPCSIGVVIEKSQTMNYDYVMEVSDQAMYEAKARGKNIYHILDHTK